MASTTLAQLKRIALLGVACCIARAADTPVTPAWTARHDQLVSRLRGLSGKESSFGPAYTPLYHAALSWYELWGGRNPNPVDDDMLSPETYATELADSLEAGRNYFAENPAALFPLVFSKTLPDGRVFSANYWLQLPAGFSGDGHRYPLVIGLHGSGWLAHKISFKRLSGPSGLVFSVTPIDMEGPWKIDFLNAYLDELMAILPVDADRVYVQGHSLGGMATWEWALENPERFAAIAPCAGIGEPYRASRLRNVPAWVIHGEKDPVIPTGFAEQMVTALQSCGAPVRYTVLPGGEHNMPADLDYGQITAWYLRQKRSTLPVPADPRDGLHINNDGFSAAEAVVRPETRAWKSGPVTITDRSASIGAAKVLFQKVHDRGERVDAPLVIEKEGTGPTGILWLAVPATLHATAAPDASIVTLPAIHLVRFYAKGEDAKAYAHIEVLRAQCAREGHPLTGKMWITYLTTWPNTPGAIAAYCLETE